MAIIAVAYYFNKTKKNNGEDDGEETKIKFICEY